MPRAAVLASLLAAACGPSPPPPPPPPPPAVAESPEAVRRELEALCHAIRESANEYYGRAQITALERQLATGGEPAEQVARLKRLGAEKLRVGEPGAAVRELSRALQLAASEELPVPVQLQLLTDLGLASLRYGEVRNCVEMHTPEMCIFPISEGGRHRDARGAEDAVRAFQGVLAGAPQFVLGRWLLNIAAMTSGRFPEAVPPEVRIPQDRLRSAEAVVPFRDVAHERGLHVFDSSGGALVDDLDGDGWLDVVTTSIDPCSPMRFFRNTGGGRFAPRPGSGLDAQLGGLNLLQTDYNNDGHLDILVLRGGWFAADGRMRNSLLRGRGDGTFEDVTRAVGLAEPAYPTQAAAWADYDLDGDLDLFIGNEGAHGAAFPAQLFRNELRPHGGEPAREAFTDVTGQAGIDNGFWAKGVAWGDYDDDGDPDLYVSNIGPNRLYRNEGDGTFTDVAAELGVTEPAVRSFATWFFDHDNDGDLDLFVADYAAPLEDVARFYLGEEVAGGHPRLYENSGGSFADVSREMGFTAPGLPMGAGFGDLDNDGFLDLYLGTGLPNYEALTPNLLYRNDGGRRFLDVTFSARVGHLQKGHGVAFADLDHDGDQEIFEQMGGAFPGDAYTSVLYDRPGNGNAWIKLEFRGVGSNRLGVGARVALEVESAADGGAGETRSIHRAVGSVGSFGAAPYRQEIGLGHAGRIRRLEVRWPATGTVQVFHGVEPGRLYRVREGTGRLEDLELPGGEP